jgi:hypothetical protein
MTSVAAALNIPTLATQQYTKVFGPTLSDCFATPDIQASVPVYDKKKFSMLTDDVQSKLTEWGKDTYLLVGIETHVCV